MNFAEQQMRRHNTVFQGGGRLALWGIVAFLVGAVGLAFGFLARGVLAMYSYLAAYTWALSTVLGALIFLMTVNAMDAKWPVAIRRVVEGVTATLPLLALGFLPILAFVPSMYPWASHAAHGDPEHQALLAHKAPYLNYPSFVVRAVVYFAIWIGAGYLLRRWSLRDDVNPEGRRKVRARILSALGLPPVALALTFAAVDWLMSLTPDWYSTMFGVYWFAGGFVAFFGLVVLLLMGVQRMGLLTELARSHWYALGRLMLAFTIFWAYIAYFQFFLIWITNKPHEASFYAPRMSGPWGIASVVLGVGHFVLPFLALLSYRLKQRAASLAPICVWLLLVHAFDMLWLVMPMARPNGAVISWIDAAAFLCVGGATLAFGVIRQRGLSIVARNDPALEAAFEYESM